MSYSNSISKEQKIFEIEERVYTLLTPELKNKYTVRDKISPFFGFFAMPLRELILELRFADTKYACRLDKNIGVT